MVTKRVDCDSPHFRIFTGGNIPRNVRLNFVAGRCVERALARDGRLSGCFSSAAGEFQIATMTRLYTSHFGNPFSLRQWPAKFSLEGANRGSLLVGDAFAGGAHVTSRHTAAATTATGRPATATATA